MPGTIWATESTMTWRLSHRAQCLVEAEPIWNHLATKCILQLRPVPCDRDDKVPLTTRFSHPCTLSSMDFWRTPRQSHRPSLGYSPLNHVPNFLNCTIFQVSKLKYRETEVTYLGQLNSKVRKLTGIDTQVSHPSETRCLLPTVQRAVEIRE